MKKTSTTKTVTDRLIDELITKRKLTNYAIAAAINTYVGTVNSWLVGNSAGANKPRKFAVPNVNFLVQLCDTYGMDLNYIATGRVSETSQKAHEAEPIKSPVQQKLNNSVPDEALGELYKQYTEMYNNMQTSIDELEEKYVKLKSEFHQLKRATAIKN